MRKLIVRMHTSLDWIAVDEEMFEIAGERTKEANLALYGWSTYQMMDGPPLPDSYQTRP